MSRFVKITNIDCSDVLLEAGKMPVLFSENDINYNVNKFLEHKVPVLWITGMSGGGKSTLATKLADETNADLLSLDSVKHFINLMIAEDKEVNDIIVQDKNFYLISKLLKKDADKYLEKPLHGKEYLALLCYLVKEVLKKHNNSSQIIIDGVQIHDMFWYDKSFYSENSAIIIKGTSLATSFFRRFKRDQGRGGFINKFSDIGKILRLYKEWYDHQNEFRATVTPNKESYSPNINPDLIENPKELNKILNKFKYGFIKNEKFVEANKGDEYRSLSPQDFVKYCCGICWDFAAYEAYWFKKHGYKYSLYFAASNNNKKTHTFLVYQDKETKKFCIFESSWWRMRGIYEYDSERKAISDYFNKFKNDDKSDKYILFKYKQPTKFNMTAQEYLNYIYDTGQIIFNEKNMYEEMTTESYSPPMSIADIKKNYPTKAGTLLKDPVHKWRAENGIELIHKEPTLDELDRIWKNWQLMTDKQKKISDDFSKKIFGKSNKEHYEELIKSYKK